MKIGFDLDKVFIDFPPFIPAKVIDKLYKKKANGTLLYRIPSAPEQYFRHLTHHPLLRSPIKENIRYLQKLSQKNHKLYLISSRFGFLKDRTQAIVKQHNFDKLFHGLHFNYENKQPHLFKTAIIKEKGLDMYIDDDLHLIKYVAKHMPQTKFYWLNPKISNQALGKNIFAITHLSDIVS